MTKAQTLDRCCGRCELRHLTLSTDLSAYLATHSRWLHIEHVDRLRRQVTSLATGLAREDVVYLITTLTFAQASPGRLLALVRCRWHIENHLHYVRHVTFGEDRSRLRSGTVPQIVAALRTLAITLTHRSGVGDIAAARCTFAYHPPRALRLLLR